MRNRTKDSFFANVDWLTVLLYVALVAIGWFNIYAAIYDEEKAAVFEWKSIYGSQLIWILCWALPIAIVILIIDAEFYAAFSYYIYGAFIFILILTLIIGTATHGSKSWIDLGFIRLQPAEFAKFATGLMLAKFLSNYELTWKKIGNYFIAIGFFLLPMILVFAENETGLALVFLTFIIVIYREGLPGWVLVAIAAVVALFIVALFGNLWILSGVLVLFAIGSFLFLRRRLRNFIIVAAILVACLGITWGTKYVYDNTVKWGLLKDYQKKRMDVMFGFEKDDKGSGYNLNQSKIAIGSGGFWGKGWLKGTQTKYNFVPEQETDFIFCTIGEEWGFVGSTIVLLLQLGLNFRILQLAERQRSPFSRIYGYCVASVLFFHLVINVGMTIGMMPVVGIPLPFISYGGSSLLAFTILIFIFVKLDSNRLSILR